MCPSPAPRCGVDDQVFVHRQNGIQGVHVEGAFGSPQAFRINEGRQLVFCSRKVHSEQNSKPGIFS